MHVSAISSGCAFKFDDIERLLAKEQFNYSNAFGTSTFFFLLRIVDQFALTLSVCPHTISGLASLLAQLLKRLAYSCLGFKHWANTGFP